MLVQKAGEEGDVSPFNEVDLVVHLYYGVE